MPETIKTGTVLIKDGTLLPVALRFEFEPCTTGWRLVKDLDGYELDRKIHDAGWTFFYLAGEIKTTSFGFDVQKTVRRAVKRILANLHREKFNSLQITQIVSKNFLGVPCVQVYAHPRHAQKSMFLFRDEDVQKWEQTKMSGDANPSVVRAKDKILSLEEIIPQANAATS